MIRIEISDEGVTNALARLAGRLTDMTPAMEEMGDYLRRSTQDRIQRGETPEGAAFAPRSQTTLDRYASMTPPMVPRGGPLVLTGTMSSQIFHQASATQVEVGSNAIQAAVMQFGAAARSLGPRSPWGNIPARPFLGLSDEDRTAIQDIVAEWLERVE